MRPIKLPKGGQGIDEGTVVEWIKSPGDPVEADEPIALYETEKMTSEIAADRDGVLLERTVEEGETVPVGTTLGYVDEGDETSADSPEEAANRTASTAGPDASVRAPPTARRLARERGVDVDEVARATGSSRVGVDDVERYVDGDARDRPPRSEPGPERESGDGADPDEGIRGSPWARVLADRRGTTIDAVGRTVGTDRVRAADVRAYADRSDESDAGTDAHEAPARSTADPRTVRETVPISGSRRVMFDRMELTNEYASTTTVARVDVTALLDLYDRLKEAWESISLTAFVVRAAALTLPDYGPLNAEIDGDALRVFDSIDVGFAVDTDRALLVPTIRDADERTLRELSSEIDRLAAAARDGSLDADALEGGTFTVSNAGSLGAYLNTPRINPPQTAILGACAVFDEAGVVDGEVRPRKMMHLTLTYDHRVVEGATAVEFLQEVEALLESPERLLS